VRLVALELWPGPPADRVCRAPRILDNLPTAQVRLREDGGRMVKTYERGYPVGFKAAPEDGGPEAHYLHNHARFTILYNRDPETDLSRIVGFEVEPASVKHRYKNRWDPVNPQLETCNSERHPLESLVGAPQAVEEGEEVVFTYDVAFKASDIRWASRWDTYLQMSDDNIHWFSIVNSLMIVLFLSGMVAMIMVRTLRRDISQYNELESAEEAAEESGWKMVHGDVFRSPPYAGALACAAGTGVQLLGMASITMCFAVLGFLSPANRGGLMTAMLLLFVLMGVAAGFTSARLFKTFGLVKWRQMTLHTALAYPGFCFAIFFTLNLLIWGQRSSGAVPFGTLIALTALWFGISVPLVFVGSYFGFKRPASDAPVRTNKIPRQVPPQPWYMAPAFSVLVGGILPFGAVFIELFFILTSLWCAHARHAAAGCLLLTICAHRLHQVYYIFGVLFVVFGILVVTCAEITIVLVRARVMDIAACLLLLTCVRYPFCRSISSCVAKIIGGGGAHFSLLVHLRFTCSCTRPSTLSRSWRSRSWCRRSCTLVRPTVARCAYVCA